MIIGIDADEPARVWIFGCRLTDSKKYFFAALVGASFPTFSLLFFVCNTCSDYKTTARLSRPPSLYKYIYNVTVFCCLASPARPQSRRAFICKSCSGIVFCFDFFREHLVDNRREQPTLTESLMNVRRLMTNVESGGDQTVIILCLNYSRIISVRAQQPNLFTFNCQPLVRIVVFVIAI